MSRGINFIRTYMGKEFYPLDPRAEELDIRDIAHALSLQCRWTGHVKFHYSVAQHCCLVSDLLPPLLKLEGLMHDASEAYLCDLARPVKHAPGLGEAYLKVEKKIEQVIADRFGLPYPMSPAVKAADSQLLMAEKAQVMPGDWVEHFNDGEGEAAVKIERWSPEKAEEEFLMRFHLLTNTSQFTTGDYAKTIGLSRHAALTRLTKMEKRGIVKRIRVFHNQGGIVRPNVLGWRFLGSKEVEIDRGIGSGEIGAEALVAGDTAISSGS